MSIALFVQEESGTLKKEIVPIASQEYFRNTWLEFSAELGLEWIPLFESGAEFTQDDIPYLIKDLNDLYAFCLDRFKGKSEPIFERLDLLLGALDTLKTSKNHSFFIG